MLWRNDQAANSGVDGFHTGIRKSFITPGETMPPGLFGVYRGKGIQKVCP